MTMIKGTGKRVISVDFEKPDWVKLYQSDTIYVHVTPRYTGRNAVNLEVVSGERFRFKNFEQRGEPIMETRKTSNFVQQPDKYQHIPYGEFLGILERENNAKIEYQEGVKKRLEDLGF